MKNLHLIATDKPSKLFYYDKHLGLARNLVKQNDGVNPQNIYITSDEEIKVGDWYFITESISKCESKYEANDLTDICKKIILTTDPQLIADGVQPIDDTFLEWFIKNPSCEKVETAKGKMKLNDDGQEYGFPDMSLYKIIIPQEEPKQDSIFENAKLTLRKHILANKEKVTEDLQEMREKSGTGRDETLEEAADNWVRQPIIGTKKESFIAGYKLAQERMYSEEEMLLVLNIGFTSTDETWEECVAFAKEQFKKK